MFPIPWYAVLFISIPQTVLIIQIGFLLFKLRVGWRESILASVLIGLAAYILPRLSLIPGVHTIVLVLITVLVISWLGKIKVVYSLVSVLCGAMIMGVTENIIMSLVLKLISRNVSELFLHPWLNIAVFMPTLLIGSLILLMVTRHNWVLYDLSMKGNS